MWSKSRFHRGVRGIRPSARSIASMKINRRGRLAFEPLEDRRLLTALVVSSSADDGSSGTLRYEIGQASPGDDIYFDPSLGGASITLQKGAVYLGSGAAVSIFGTDTSGNLLQITINGAKTNLFQVAGGASLSLTGLTLANGDAASGAPYPPYSGTYGGAINNQGTLVAEACTFSSNAAVGQGGAIANAQGGSVCLTGCTLSGNSGQTGGGGLYNDGTMTVTGCTLSANLGGSQASGGAIYNDSGGAMTVATSTLGKNSAPTGGAIYNAGQLTLSAATISGNWATYGAGIATVGILTLADTIVANGPVSTGCDPDVDGAVTGSSSDNLIGDGTGLSGISNGQGGNQIGNGSAPLDPGLAPLGNYGGSTQTMPPMAGSLALAAGGPITILVNGIGNQVTQFQVADAATIASTAAGAGSPIYIQIDGEVMAVTSVDLGSNTLTVVRYTQPPAVGHNQSAGVYFEFDQSGNVVHPAWQAIGAAQIPGPPTTIQLAAANTTETAGVPFTVSLTAQDNWRDTCTGDNGSVKLSAGGQMLYGITVGQPPVSVADSTDPIIPLENGKATVTFNLNTAGPVTLTAQQQGSGGQGNANGSTGLTVTPAWPWSITAAAGVRTEVVKKGGLQESYNNAGVGFPLTVRAWDKYGNETSAAGLLASNLSVASGDKQPVTSTPFAGSASDPLAIVSTTTLDKLSKSVTLTVTSSYFSPPAKVAAAPKFAIFAGVATHFIVTASSGSATACKPFTLSITPEDQWNNPTTDNAVHGPFKVTLSTDTQNVYVSPASVSFPLSLNPAMEPSSPTGKFSVFLNLVGSASVAGPIKIMVTETSVDPTPTGHSGPVKLKAKAVPANFSKNVKLLDPGIQQLAVADFNKDGTLTYSDMLGIFQDAEIELAQLGAYEKTPGSNASTEETNISTDLKTLAGGGASNYLKLTAEVQYLATQVADPIPDDVTFLARYCTDNPSMAVPTTAGPALGDGSSVGEGDSAQLAALVDQWFLGTVYPGTLPQPGYYTPTSGDTFGSVPNSSLFGPDGVPLCTDVCEGNLPSCGPAATMAEVAYLDPKAIQSAFDWHSSNDTYTVRIYDDSNGRGNAEQDGPFPTVYVTIDDKLPHDCMGNIKFTGVFDGVLWPALMMKAFAEYNTEYAYDRRPGSFAMLTNCTECGGNGGLPINTSAINAINTALDNGDFVNLATPGTPADVMIPGQHFMSVLGRSGGNYLIYNPWGIEPVAQLSGPKGIGKDTRHLPFTSLDPLNSAGDMFKGNYIKIDQEMMYVEQNDNSGNLYVDRGKAGTQASHFANSDVYLCFHNGDPLGCNIAAIGGVDRTTGHPYYGLFWYPADSIAANFFGWWSGGSYIPPHSAPGAAAARPTGAPLAAAAPVAAGPASGDLTALAALLPSAGALQAPAVEVAAALPAPARQAPPAGPGTAKLLTEFGQAPAAASPATHAVPLAAARNSADLAALDSMLAAWPAAKRGEDTNSGRNWNELAASLLIQHKL